MDEHKIFRFSFILLVLAAIASISVIFLPYTGIFGAAYTADAKIVGVDHDPRASSRNLFLRVDDTIFQQTIDGNTYFSFEIVPAVGECATVTVRPGINKASSLLEILSVHHCASVSPVGEGQ